MSEKTPNLNLNVPVTGTYGWHVDWDRNMDSLDAHPGIKTVTSVTRPPSPWIGQVIFETDSKNLMVFDGDVWALWLPVA